jgi:TRAP-type C4-dicarboxylate transport system permease small subunit
MLGRAFHWFGLLVGALNGVFAAMASAFAAIIVAVVVISIVARSIGVSLIWANDVAQICFVYLVFLALGPALESGHHVTVEMFEPLVPKPFRRYLDLIAALANVIFGFLFLQQLLYLTNRSFSDDRLAIAAIAVPLKWIQLAGPVGLAQFVLTALLQFWRALRDLYGAGTQKAGAI